MSTKTIRNRKLDKYGFSYLKDPNKCKVSKASNELMLDRFYNGKEVEFPFSK
tara:strand:- start:385 stop:540 length:156 start_codon:yes stop_codon:yes gene_type:complete